MHECQVEWKDLLVRVFWVSPFLQAELFCSLSAFQQEKNVLALTLGGQLFSLCSKDSWIAVLKKGKEIGSIGNNYNLSEQWELSLGEMEGSHQHQTKQYQLDLQLCFSTKYRGCTSYQQLGRWKEWGKIASTYLSKYSLITFLLSIWVEICNWENFTRMFRDCFCFSFSSSLLPSLLFHSSFFSYFSFITTFLLLVKSSLFCLGFFQQNNKKKRLNRNFPKYFNKL